MRKIYNNHPKSALLRKMLARLDQMVRSGDFLRLSVLQYRRFVHRLRRLFRQLRPNLSGLRLRPVVWAALTGLGIGISTPVKAQIFDSTMVSPFGLPTANGYQSTVTLADIDLDGDLDLFSGISNGNILYIQNTGTATSPAFGSIQINPFSITAGTTYTAIALADIDNDGDLDLFVGENYPVGLHYMENTGTATVPVFGLAQANPFGLNFSQPPANSAYHTRPTFADLDNDGDFDLTIGINYGNILYFENTGSASAPAFSPFLNNPFGLAAMPNYAAPAYGDLDKDGDLDLIVSGNSGNMSYYENTGTVNAPAFGQAQALPFGLQPGDNYTAAALADLDGDGDLDCLKGNENGEFWYQKNSSPLPPVIALSVNVDTICDMDTFGPIPFTVNDPDSPLASLTAISTNQGRIPTSSLVIGGTGPNYTISGMSNNFGDTKIIITATDTTNTVKDTINVRVNNCSMAIDNDFFARTFEVYPNPGSGALHYRLELLSPVDKILLEMVDLQGRVCLSKQAKEAGTNFMGILDVSSLASGIYFLRVRTGLYRFNRKVVIK